MNDAVKRVIRGLVKHCKTHPGRVYFFSDSPTARPQTYKAPEPRLFYYLEKPLNWGFTCRDGEI